MSFFLFCRSGSNWEWDMSSLYHQALFILCWKNPSNLSMVLRLLREMPITWPAISFSLNRYPGIPTTPIRLSLVDVCAGSLLSRIVLFVLQTFPALVFSYCFGPEARLKIPAVRVFLRCCPVWLQIWLRIVFFFEKDFLSFLLIVDSNDTPS